MAWHRQEHFWNFTTRITIVYQELQEASVVQNMQLEEDVEDSFLPLITLASDPMTSLPFTPLSLCLILVLLAKSNIAIMF